MLNVSWKLILEKKSTQGLKNPIYPCFNHSQWARQLILNSNHLNV